MTLYPCAYNFTTCTSGKFLEQHRKYSFSHDLYTKAGYNRPNPMRNDTTYIPMHIISQHEHQENFLYSTKNVSSFSHNFYVDAGYGRPIL
jgi:hypothetical protein